MRSKQSPEEILEGAESALNQMLHSVSGNTTRIETVAEILKGLTEIIQASPPVLAKQPQDTEQYYMEEINHWMGLALENQKTCDHKAEREAEAQKKYLKILRETKGKK